MLNQNRLLETKLFMLKHLDHDCCKPNVVANTRYHTKAPNRTFTSHCECNCDTSMHDINGIKLFEIQHHGRYGLNQQNPRDHYIRYDHIQPGHQLKRYQYKPKDPRYTGVTRKDYEDQIRHRRKSENTVNQSKGRFSVSDIIRQDILKNMALESKPDKRKVEMPSKASSIELTIKKTDKVKEPSYNDDFTIKEAVKAKTRKEMSILSIIKPTTVRKSEDTDKNIKKPKNYEISTPFEFRRIQSTDELKQFIETYTPRSKNDNAKTQNHVIDTFDLPGPLLTFKKPDKRYQLTESENNYIPPVDSDIQQNNTNTNNVLNNSSNIFNKAYEDDSDNQLIELKSNPDRYLKTYREPDVKAMSLKSNFRHMSDNNNYNYQCDKAPNLKPKRQIRFLDAVNKEEESVSRNATPDNNGGRTSSRSTSFIRSRNNSVDLDQTMPKSINSQTKKIDFFIPADEKVKGGFISKLPRDLHSPVNFDINKVPKLKKVEIKNSLQIL